MRFPEFSDEWEKQCLGNLGTTIIGLTYKPSDLTNDGSGIIVFRSSNIQKGMIDYSDLVRVSKKIKSNLFTQEDDILICARNGSEKLIGKNAIIEKSDANKTFGAFMMIYRSQQNGFVKQLLETRRYATQISENLGARINQVTTSDFNRFEFFFPKTDEEKKKIAIFLRLIDKRIALQNKIIEKYKSLIKGIGDILLVDNSSRSIPLSKILIEFSEKTTKNNQYEVLSSTVSGIYSQKEIFNKEVASSNNIGYKIIHYDDVVLSPQNLWMGNINYNDKYKIGIVSPSYKTYRIAEDYDKKFIAAILKTHRALYNYMLVSEQGASVVRRNLNIEAFEQLIFKIPNYEKQQKIGNILRNLEYKLNRLERLKNCYLRQKQFFLQQMFI